MRKVTRNMEMVMSRVITVRVVMELKSLNSLTKIEGPSIGQISKNSNGDEQSDHSKSSD